MGLLRSLRWLWLWASASWLAITILRRMLRGEVVVLSAHAAPVVRLVAIVLVFLAGCAEKLQPQVPDPHGSPDMSQEPDDPAPVAAPVAAPEPPGVAAGASLRLRRLDLVRAPAGATLQHPKLGEIVLPAGAELSAWKLGEFVAQLVPALHLDIRYRLLEKPDAPGAPGLRLVLANFDE